METVETEMTKIMNEEFGMSVNPRKLTKIPNFIKTFMEDRGLATYWHNESNRECMIDNAPEFEASSLLYFRQGIIHQYTIIIDGVNILVYHKDVRKNHMMDMGAFQWGHLVNGLATIVRSECFHCRKKRGESALKICSGCYQAYYCSRDCQGSSF